MSKLKLGLAVVGVASILSRHAFARANAPPPTAALLVNDTITVTDDTTTDYDAVCENERPWVIEYLNTQAKAVTLTYFTVQGVVIWPEGINGRPSPEDSAVILCSSEFKIEWPPQKAPQIYGLAFAPRPYFVTYSVVSYPNGNTQAIDIQIRLNN
jgi:hypothetical protein